MLDDLSCLFGIGIEKFLDNDPEKFRDRLMSSYLSMTLLSVMIHGQCGHLNPRSPFTKDDKKKDFRKTFPRKRKQETMPQWVFRKQEEKA